MMGNTAARGFAAPGVFAIFDEPNTSGAPTDFDAPRNAPAKVPEDWLEAIRFHVDFDYYQVHSGPTPVTVTHASVASASTNINLPSGRTTIVRSGQIVASHIDLVTHGLGYVPAYMVVSGGEIIAPGTVIQAQTSPTRLRTVTPYATTSKIRLYDVGISGSSTLSSLSKDYEVLVFRAPVEDSDQLFNFDTATGRLILGLGKFDNDRLRLRQAGAGDSAFDISLGRTVDIRNGRARTVLANGTTVTEAGYDGSFAGSGSIQCAVG